MSDIVEIVMKPGGEDEGIFLPQVEDLRMDLRLLLVDAETVRAFWHEAKRKDLKAVVKILEHQYNRLTELARLKFHEDLLSIETEEKKIHRLSYEDVGDGSEFLPQISRPKLCAEVVLAPEEELSPELQLSDTKELVKETQTDPIVECCTTCKNPSDFRLCLECADSYARAEVDFDSPVDFLNQEDQPLLEPRLILNVPEHFGATQTQTPKEYLAQNSKTRDTAQAIEPDCSSETQKPEDAQMNTDTKSVSCQSNIICSASSPDLHSITIPLTPTVPTSNVDTENESEELTLLSQPLQQPTRSMQSCNIGMCRGKGRMVLNLRRHMEEVHGISKEMVDMWRYSSRSEKAKKKNPARLCPLCHRPQANLGRHLKGPVHSIEATSMEYIELVRTAAKYEPLIQHQITDKTDYKTETKSRGNVRLRR